MTVPFLLTLARRGGRLAAGLGANPGLRTVPASSRDEPERWAGISGNTGLRSARPSGHCSSGPWTRRPGPRWGGDRGARPRTSPCWPSVPASWSAPPSPSRSRGRMLQARPRRDADVAPSARRSRWERVPRVLFICGSPNQTGQMLQIAEALPEVEAWFSAVLLGRPASPLAMLKGRHPRAGDQRPQAPRHLRRRAERRGQGDRPRRRAQRLRPLALSERCDRSPGLWPRPPGSWSRKASWSSPTGAPGCGATPGSFPGRWPPPPSSA